MPNTNRLSKGCKVTGNVGPFVEAAGDGKRRQRVVLTGVIIGSGEKPQWWRVYWKGAQLISDHSGRTLKYVSAPANIDLVETTIRMCNLMETNFVKQPSFFLVSSGGIGAGLSNNPPGISL